MSTEGRTRTGTRCKPHWILSPARLPIPPLRQKFNSRYNSKRAKQNYKTYTDQAKQMQ